MDAFQLLCLALVGLAAGAGNAIAGGGTLLSFPALMAMGLPPVEANVTSSVGLVAGYVGGSMGYRRELYGQGRRISALGVTSLLGAGLGAIVLLQTPDTVFRGVAPYLVLLSCLLLAVQPVLAAQVARRSHGRKRHLAVALHSGVVTSAFYGSYFGAGLGVLLLGIVGICVNDTLQRLNGLKTVLSLLIKLVGVCIFVGSGFVSWSHAFGLAPAGYVGGLLGVALVRRLSPHVLRWCIIIIGTGVAIILLARA